MFVISCISRLLSPLTVLTHSSSYAFFDLECINFVGFRYLKARSYDLTLARYLCYLRDTMLRQCSPCCLIIPMLVTWHYTTQWSSSPLLLMSTILHHCSPDDLPPVLRIWESIFLLSGVFYFGLLPSFQGFPVANSSTSELAGLHVDLRNIAPAWLFVWVTIILKRFICGRFNL